MRGLSGREWSLCQTAGRAPREVVHRRRHAPLELVVVVGVEEVVLAVVLVVDHRLHPAKAGLEHRVLRGALRLAAVRVAPPHDPRAREVRLLAPPPLVDEGLEPRPVGAGARAEHPVAGPALRLLRGRSARREARDVGRPGGGERVAARGLVEAGDGPGRRVEERDLGRERVAEEPRHAKGHVHPRAVEEVEGEDLEPGDPPGARLPRRPHSHEGESLRDVVAAGSHVRRAPRGEGHPPRPLPVLLAVALDEEPRPTSSRGARPPRWGRCGCRRSRSSAPSAARRGARGSGRRTGRARGSARRGR